MKKVIVITGASSGFGALPARALARAGDTVYASMRETAGRNEPQVAEVRKYAAEHKVDIRAIELDVSSQESSDAAIGKIIDENGRLEVIVHNAGHMVFGPAEAFTPEQFAELYDANVLSAQRVNRSASSSPRAGNGSGRLDLQQQRARRNAPVSRSVLRRQGRDGFPRRELRQRAGARRDRDVHHRAGRVHGGNQSLQERRGRAEFLRRIGLGDLLAPRKQERVR